MLDWGSIPSLEATAGTASGAWVFKGTRVPVRAVFENISDDYITEFCCHFPNVTEEQVRAVLEHIAQALVEDTVTTSV